jgi:uncharacterized membrane protein YhaH (DUF805 family)
MHATAIDQLGFTGAITAALAKYTDIQGRASRREYWYFTLFLVVASLTTLGMDLGIWRSMTFTPFNAMFAFLTIIPGLAVSIRRLHDIGRSGWWLLIVGVPLAGAVMFVYWACLPGDQASNQYGGPTG